MAYRNPVPTVDIIVQMPAGIVLIRRSNPPLGWALPGGFVDYGETVQHAAIREAKEETGLDVELNALLHVYSDPKRDPRQHTLSVTFVATATGDLQAGDDAADVCVFALDALPEDLAFDHRRILSDYQRYRESGLRPLES